LHHKKTRQMLASFLNVSKLKNSFEIKSILYNDKSTLDDSKILHFIKSFFKKTDAEFETNLVKILSEEANFNHFKKEDFFTIIEIVNESSQQIALVIGRCNTIYSDVVESIGLRDLEKLKASKIALDELNDEVELLKDTVYCFLQSLDTNSVEANKFYVLILSYLQDLVQSTKYISEDSFLYISNKHQLKFNQIRDLKKIEKLIQNLFNKIEMAFLNKNFEKIDEILIEKTIVLENISELIQKQIIRIRAINDNAKNSDVYFSLLLKTKDVIKSSIDLLVLFQNFNPNLKKR